MSPMACAVCLRRTVLSSPALERAQPWLGTRVSIRVASPDAVKAAAAIAHAFAAIAHIHSRMSAQSPRSDLAAIARLAPGETATLDPETAACLAEALALADASRGVFDPVLPEAGGADWRDLVLQGGQVRVRRRLRIDLSGIAKGYAVDRACTLLQEAGLASALVNAGGDLRCFGPAEIVALRPYAPAPPAAIEIENGALASSDVAGSLAEYGAACHRHGRTARPMPPGFVSVVAPRCVDADGLTKLVLAESEAAIPLLQSRAAIAYLHRPDGDWRVIGAATPAAGAPCG
ncbi:FAD:protein FMN transferase [Sphingomonas morindae]|uniref:FAD:protein FMN transferase n=1 Tax=Sphingomonas morindae TaxID=1541170 RepID=A0ABY4XD90_9SPHN|nr:FAD:protein FMN transferase [Sphingomonas morindae]USI74809.1 FAD:protein FMN transferase [Sphingomonas morindae]